MHTLIQVVIDGIILGGFYALMAQGLSMIFGIMRVINLAHGEFLVIGAYLAWMAHEYLGLDVLAVLPILIILGFVIGWAVSRLLVIPVLERPELMPLLITFGLAAVIQGVLTLVFTTTPRMTTAFYSNSILEFLGYRISVARLVMLVAAIVLLGLLSLFLNRTKAGKAMRATAENREAARIVGIDVTRIYCAAFGVGTAAAVAAGALFSVTQGFYPFSGPLFTLKAFVIVILGGRGRISGTLAAAMFVGLIESALSGYVPNVGTGLGTAAAFILVVIVLATRPKGIFQLRGVNA
ncbi:branched-chain amino acid ABC transporter permease [Paralcaligenes sp. KSB-10]|uniref:branched-chain amino acid ABC transporter permease n=1 Tax=Paralcaligenes sp. KSB-10 TaxID=2901142 RepID=UPI001E2DD14A|nr:branched-chain amino acid ABC transporter permease [Paralcaligenes sp. KSB-10]UHL64268.1 branched-chain amino acid ABC transporter permease [Paralcaligenes sp. KSB-10]